MIQRGCTYRAEDTHTEQRKYSGYTYRAENSKHSRGYTLHKQSRGHKYIAEDTHYTFRAEHADVEQRIHSTEQSIQM